MLSVLTIKLALWRPLNLCVNAYFLSNISSFIHRSLYTCPDFKPFVSFSLMSLQISTVLRICVALALRCTRWYRILVELPWSCFLTCLFFWPSLSYTHSSHVNVTWNNGTVTYAIPFGSICQALLVISKAFVVQTQITLFTVQSYCNQLCSLRTQRMCSCTHTYTRTHTQVPSHKKS